MREHEIRKLDQAYANHVPEKPTVETPKIGGSRIAAVCGLDKRKSRFDVWLELVEGVKQEASLAMKLGTFLEPFVAKEYQELTGYKLQGPTTVESTKYPWARGNLDDIATTDSGEQYVVDYKTASIRLAHEWKENIPTSYICQVQFYMALTGLKRAELPVLLGNESFEIKRVDADEELQIMLLSAASNFWRDYVLTKTPPPVDASPAIEEWAIRNRQIASAPTAYWRDEPEADELARKWKTATEECSKWEGEQQRLRNELLLKYGEHECIQGNGYQLRFSKRAGRKSTKWAEIVKELKAPDSLINKYSTIGKEFAVFNWKDSEDWKDTND